MNPSAQSSPTPTPPSVPGGPLGRYLLHPGQETSTLAHHVLRVLVGVGRTALPVLVAVMAVAVVTRLMLAVTHRQRSGGGQVVRVAPGPEVDPSGAEALWNGLHGVLRRGGVAGTLSGRPHVAFEVGWEAGRLRFGLWLPAGVSAVRVARVVEAAWPGAVTEVLDAGAPLPGGAGIAGGELRLVEPEWFALRVDQPADPYRLLLAALSGLGAGQAGVVQVLARPATRRRYARCRKAAIALRTGRPRSRLDAYRFPWRASPWVEGRGWKAVGGRRSHDNTAPRAGRATRAQKARRRRATPPKRTSTPCASSANVPPRPGKRPVRSHRWRGSSASGRSRTGVGREAHIDEGRSRGDLGRDRTHP